MLVFVCISVRAVESLWMSGVPLESRAVGILRDDRKGVCGENRAIKRAMCP